MGKVTVGQDDAGKDLGRTRYDKRDKDTVGHGGARWRRGKTPGHGELKKNRGGNSLWHTRAGKRRGNLESGVALFGGRTRYDRNNQASPQVFKAK